MDIPEEEKPQALYDVAYAESVREKHLKHEHSDHIKREMHQVATDGETEKFIKMIKSGYFALFEEISQSGYFWASLHYACHYGHVDFVKFILDEIKDLPENFELANLQDNLGQTPWVLTIVNCENVEKKRQTLQLFVDYELINTKLLNQDGKDVFTLAAEHDVSDIVQSLKSA